MSYQKTVSRYYSFEEATARANSFTRTWGRYFTAIRLSTGKWVASDRFHPV